MIFRFLGGFESYHKFGSKHGIYKRLRKITRIERYQHLKKYTSVCLNQIRTSTTF